MKKKLFLTSLLLSSLLFAACGKLEKGASNIDPGIANSNQTITTGRIDDSVYQALLVNGKYQSGIANNVETSTLNSNYNQNNFETGLLQLAKQQFSVDSYYFQEGQKLDGLTLKSWLQRKSADNPDGLNPEDTGKGQGIQKILEYDFFDVSSEKLAGMVIGIALNKVDYSQDPAVELTQDEMLTQGRQAANSVLTRIRQNGELKDLPIYIALFQQAEKTNVAGGNYILGSLSEGTATVDKWANVAENHIFLPTSGTNEATEDGLNDAFTKFKTQTISFFPNLTGVTGIAYYSDKKLVKLTIEVQSGYYSKTEITSFTQFVGKTAEESFAAEVPWEITVNSVKGPQSYIVKTPGEKKSISHIFN